MRGGGIVRKVRSTFSRSQERSWRVCAVAAFFGTLLLMRFCYRRDVAEIIRQRLYLRAFQHPAIPHERSVTVLTPAVVVIQNFIQGVFQALDSTEGCHAAVRVRHARRLSALVLGLDQDRARQRPSSVVPSRAPTCDAAKPCVAVSFSCRLEPEERKFGMLPVLLALVFSAPPPDISL